MKIHTFDSTQEAYNDSQTGYVPLDAELPPLTESTISEWNAAYDAATVEVSDGDILVVPSENVVGIMVRAWPTAVSMNAGSFHTLDNDTSWDDLDGGKYLSASLAAQNIVQNFDIPNLKY